MKVLKTAIIWNDTS